MDVHHNRGSPRLQFTKEELESDTLSRPIVRAEKAADRHNEARKKLKRKQLRLIREEPDTLPESGRKTAGDVPRADTESMFFASEPVEETEQAAGVQTDPERRVSAIPVSVLIPERRMAQNVPVVPCKLPASQKLNRVFPATGPFRWFPWKRTSPDGKRRFG